LSKKSYPRESKVTSEEEKSYPRPSRVTCANKNYTLDNQLSQANRRIDIQLSKVKLILSN
jgi:hypothetical protein